MSTNMVGVMTVNELMQECQMLINSGFGDKHIYLSKDDEGNGFHPLYYTFTTSKQNIEELLDYTDVDNSVAEAIVILG